MTAIPVLAIPPILAIPPLLPIPPEIRLRQLLELAGGIPAASRVPVSGQIHEVERRRRSALHPKHIGEPRFSRSRAGSRQTLPEQRVNQARFANVRTPHHGDFRQAVHRQIGCARGARNEFGGDFQRAGGAGRAGRAGKINTT
jgi:hypothetical protein